MRRVYIYLGWRARERGIARASRVTMTRLLFENCVSCILARRRCDATRDALLLCSAVIDCAGFFIFRVSLPLFSEDAFEIDDGF